MSDYGIYTYVNGTTLDAINSLDFNYALDLIQISGSGSKTYDVDTSDGLVLKYMIYEQTTLVDYQKTHSLSMNGKTFTWNVSTPLRVAIIGEYT